MKKSLILRIGAFLLAFAMLFSFVGCGPTVTISEVWIDVDEVVSDTENADNSSNDATIDDESSSESITGDASSAIEDKKDESSKTDDKKDDSSKTGDKKDESSKSDNKNTSSSKTEDNKEESSKAEDKNESSKTENSKVESSGNSSVADKGTSSVGNTSNVQSNTTDTTDKELEEVTQVYGNINLKSGKKAAEAGLDLGGKEYTMAVWNSPEYLDDAFKNKVKAFQKKFNCKIKVVELGWDEYLTKLNQATVSGKPYDIVFIHGSMYANGVTKGLYADLSKKITTADLVDENNKDVGGIDMTRSLQFSYKNGLYGLTGSYASAPYIMYYNKLLFSQYFKPDEDPYTLYTKGEWTWDKIFEMAEKVVNPSRQMYMLDASCVMRSLILDAGGSLVTPNGDTYKENLTDPKVVKGVQFFQDLFSAEKGIASTAGGAFDTSEFYAGHSFIFCQEAIKYSGYAADVVDLTTFGKNKNNLGVVPYPIMDSNTEGLYPTGWLEATAACKGVKEDRLIAAVAWAKFSASYKNPITSKTSMTKEQSELVRKLATGKIIYPNYGFASTSTTLDELYLKIPEEILQGKSVPTVLSNYRQPFQDCINATFN